MYLAFRGHRTPGCCQHNQLLQRLDLYEVPPHLVDSDPLGPMIDRAITGKTIRLDQCEEEAPYGTR